MSYRPSMPRSCACVCINLLPARCMFSPACCCGCRSACTTREKVSATSSTACTVWIGDWAGLAQSHRRPRPEARPGRRRRRMRGTRYRGTDDKTSKLSLGACHERVRHNGTSPRKGRRTRKQKKNNETLCRSFRHSPPTPSTTECTGMQASCLSLALTFPSPPRSVCASSVTGCQDGEDKVQGAAATRD